MVNCSFRMHHKQRNLPCGITLLSHEAYNHPPCIHYLLPPAMTKDILVCHIHQLSHYLHDLAEIFHLSHILYDILYDIAKEKPLRIVVT